MDKGNSVVMAQENKTVMGPALFAKSVILHGSSICPRGKAKKSIQVHVLENIYIFKVIE